MAADRVCCGIDDVGTICTGDSYMELFSCNSLPTNITMITGAVCKFVYIFKVMHAICF